MKKTCMFPMNARWIPAVLAIAAMVAAPCAFAQGTAFTYQGQLDDAGSVADGSYDMEFKVWNASVGGGLVSVQTYYGIPVDGGLFTRELDFGSGVFTGAARWLEIGVQTNGGGGFTTLSPRTKVTSAPYAIAASTAQTAASVPASSIGASEVANESLGAADLGPNSVGTSEVIDNSLMAIDLAADSVGASEIAAGAVASSEVLDNSLTAIDLAADSVTASEIATGAVASLEVLDNSLTASDLAADSVGTSEIAANAVGALEIAASAVGTSEVADGSLTTADLNLASVDARYVEVSGDLMTGDLEIQTSYPFITLDRQSTTDNSGISFKQGSAYTGWLYLRGSDQALAMSAGTSANGQDDLVLSPSGLVGVGRLATAAKFEVEGVNTNDSSDAMVVYNSVNTDLFHIENSGQVGVGTASPNSRFHVNGDGVSPSFRVQNNGGTRLSVNANGGTTIGTLSDAGAPVGGLYVSGDVTIGATASGAAVGYKLSVNGKIACEEVLVQDSASWPDYVFAADYNLRPLEEVEAHIKANKRLPGIPSADAVAEEGISVGQMQKQMMEKIEELTLYILDQDKRIAGLENQLAE